MKRRSMNPFRDSRGRRRDWLDFVPLLVGVFAVIALVVSLCFGVYLVDAKTCTATGEKLGYEAEYGLWTGCLYRVDGQWVEADTFRPTQEVEGES